MPYVTKKRRDELKPLTDAVLLFMMQFRDMNEGDLNYLVTTVINQWYGQGEMNYGRMNAVMGAMSGAQAEFYRRIVAPYEDTKIEEDGDVYPAAQAPQETATYDPEYGSLGPPSCCP